MPAPETPAARLLWAVAAWTLVVLAGSWSVWAVISTVGGDPGTDVAVPVPSGPTRTSAAETPGPGAARGTTPSGETRSPSEPARPMSPAGSAGTPSGDASPDARPEDGTSGRGPAVRTLTWTGAAGVVTTRCTGSRIELAGASASADGYVVEVDDRGPGRVRVEFEGRGDETVPETRVEARCVGGVPSYDVRTEG